MYILLAYFSICLIGPFYLLLTVYSNYLFIGLQHIEFLLYVFCLAVYHSYDFLGGNNYLPLLGRLWGFCFFLHFKFFCELVNSCWSSLNSDAFLFQGYYLKHTKCHFYMCIRVCRSFIPSVIFLDSCIFDSTHVSHFIVLNSTFIKLIDKFLSCSLLLDFLFFLVSIW